MKTMQHVKTILLAVVVLAAGCSSGSDVPNPVAPGGGGSGGGIGSGDGTLSGTVVRQLDGSPVGGATIIAGSAIAATTDAQGNFFLNGVVTSGPLGVVVNAPGHVFRRVALSMTPNRTGVVIRAIRDQAPFNLDFYRMWVRDSLEGQTLQITRPWTQNPNFYFQTELLDIDGEIVPDDVIDRLAGIFAASIPELSGGRRQIATVERGTEPREVIDGWVNVVFARNLGGSLGRSTIGGNSGTMSFVYAPNLLSTPTNNPFNCEFPLYSVADHEITHTMGYWHTIDVFVDSFSGPGCTGAGRPEHIRLHSDIMYSRPPGNMDPDVDPPSALQSTAPGPGSGPVVACFRQ